MTDPLDPRTYLTPQLVGSLALVAVFFQALRLWRPFTVQAETPRRRSGRVVSLVLFIGLSGLGLVNTGSSVEVAPAAAAGPAVTLTKNTTAHFTASEYASSDVALKFTSATNTGERVAPVSNTANVTAGMVLKVRNATAASSEWIMVKAVDTVGSTITATFNTNHAADTPAGTGKGVLRITVPVTLIGTQSVAVTNTDNVTAGTVLLVGSGTASELVTVNSIVAGTSINVTFTKTHADETPATTTRMSFSSATAKLTSIAANIAPETTLYRYMATSGTAPTIGKGGHAVQGFDGLYLVAHGNCTQTWSVYDAIRNEYVAGAPAFTPRICSGGFSIRTDAVASSKTFVMIAGGRLTNTTSDASSSPRSTVKVTAVPANIALTITGAIAANAAPQTVTVTNTTNVTVGTSLWIDAGAAAEMVVVTAVPSATQITGIFAKAHVANTQVRAGGFTVAAGPTLSGGNGCGAANTEACGAGVGAHAIKRTDGAHVIVHGGGMPTTEAGETGTTLISTGASPSAVVGPTGLGTTAVLDGALSIPRTDGAPSVPWWMHPGGGATNSFVYTDGASPGAFAAGGSLPANHKPLAGAHVIETAAASCPAPVTTRCYRVVIGGASTRTATFNPNGGNNLASASVLAGSAGAGSFSVQRADGSALTFLGNATTTTNTFIAGVFAVGPVSPVAVGVGAFAFQKPDGDYLAYVGGAAGSVTALNYDGGYRLRGSHTTEALNPGDVNRWTDLSWTKAEAGASLTFRVRTAATKAGLGTAVYSTVATPVSSGVGTVALSLPLAPIANKWVQVDSLFDKGVPAATLSIDVWRGSASVAYSRTVSADPSVTQLQLSYTTGQFVIGGATSRQAGVGAPLTVTLRDDSLNTIVDYAGTRTLVFASATNAPDGTTPKVTNASATDIVFGAATTTAFTSGSASPTVKLYNVESPTLSVTEDTSTRATPLGYTLSATTLTTSASLLVSVSPGVTAAAPMSSLACAPTLAGTTKVPADDAATFDCTMTLKDAFLNVAPLRTPTMASSLPATFGPVGATNLSGITTVTVRSGRAASHTITATAPDGAPAAQITGPADFRPTLFTVAPNLPPQGATANVPFSIALTAKGFDGIAATNYSGNRVIGFTTTATRRTAPVNRMAPRVPCVTVPATDCVTQEPSRTLTVNFSAAGAGTTPVAFVLTNSVELPTITAVETAGFRSLTLGAGIARSLTPQIVPVSTLAYVAVGTVLYIGGANPEVVQVKTVFLTAAGGCATAPCIEAVFVRNHVSGDLVEGGTQGVSTSSCGTCITVQENTDDTLTSLVVFTRHIDLNLVPAITPNASPQVVQVTNVNNVVTGLSLVLVVIDNPETITVTALYTTSGGACPTAPCIEAVFTKSHVANARVLKGDIFMKSQQVIAKSPTPQTVPVDNTANVIVGSRVFVDSGAAAELVTVTAVDPGFSVTGIFVKDHTLGTLMVQGEIQTANVSFIAHLVLVDIAGNPVTGLSGNKTVDFTWTATQRPLKQLLTGTTASPGSVQTIQMSAAAPYNGVTGISTSASAPTELNVDVAELGELVQVFAVGPGVTPAYPASFGPAGAPACPGAPSTLSCIVGVFTKAHVANTVTVAGLAPTMTPQQTFVFNSGEAAAPSPFTLMNRSELPTISATISYGSKFFTGTSSPITVQVNVVSEAASELTVKPTCADYDACVNADGIEIVTWTVRVYDVAKNPLENRTVEGVSSRGVTDTVTQPAPAQTNAAGIAQGTIRSTAPGSAILSARAFPRNPTGFLIPADLSYQAFNMTRVVYFAGRHFVLTLKPDGGVAVPATPVVDFTITPAITANAAAPQTVTVSNTINVVVGNGLLVNEGGSDFEVVLVKAKTATTLTAVFAKNHAANATIKAYTSVNAGKAFELYISYSKGLPPDEPDRTYTGLKTITFSSTSVARVLPDRGPAAIVPTPQSITFTDGIAAGFQAVTLPGSQFLLFNAAETPVISANQAGAFLGLTPPLTVVPGPAALGAQLTSTGAIAAGTQSVTMTAQSVMTNVVVGTYLVVEPGTLNAEVVQVSGTPPPSGQTFTATFVNAHPSGVRLRFGTLLSASPTSGVADGAASSAITATVTDAFHNPRSGFNVSITTDGTLANNSEIITPNGGNNTQPATGVTNASGVFVATATSKTVRTSTYTVTIVSGPAGGATGTCLATAQVVWTAATTALAGFTVTHLVGSVVDFVFVSGASIGTQPVPVSNITGLNVNDELIIDSAPNDETIKITAIVPMGGDPACLANPCITATFTKAHALGLRHVGKTAGQAFGLRVVALKQNGDTLLNFCDVSCTIRITHTATAIGTFAPSPASPTDLVVTFVSGVWESSGSYPSGLMTFYRVAERPIINVLDANDANGANGTAIAITVNPAPASAANSSVFLFRRTAPADGTTEVKVWGRALDAFGNAKKEAFTFTTSLGLFSNASQTSPAVPTDDAPSTGTSASPVILKSDTPGLGIVSATMGGVPITATTIYWVTPGSLTLVGTYWGEVNDGLTVKYPLEVTPFADCKFRACELDYPNFKQGQPLPFGPSTITVWRVWTPTAVGGVGVADFDNPTGVPFGPTMNTSGAYAASDHRTAFTVRKPGPVCITAEWQNPDGTLTVVDIAGQTERAVGDPNQVLKCIATPAAVTGGAIYDVTSVVDGTTTRVRAIWDGTAPINGVPPPSDAAGRVRVITWWSDR